MCSVCLGLLQENLCFKFTRSGKILQDMKYPDASLDDRLLLKANGLFLDEAELFFLFQATNCHFPS